MVRFLPLCLIVTALFGCGEQRNNEAAHTPADEVAATVAAATPPPTISGVLPVSGSLRQNNSMKLMVTEAGFVVSPDRLPPAGQRYYTVGLRGASRTRSDVAIQVRQFVFAQNEDGCISRPEMNAPWLTHALGETAVFSQSPMTDGQLAFPVPDDSKHVRVLIASADAQSLAVPAGEDFTPTWPAPVQTIEDGSTLRVLVLPAPTPPPALPPPAAGREQVVMDFVIENLTTEHGIEFTTSQQLRMVDASGKFVQPSAATREIGCRLDDGDVVPPGHARRLQVAFDMPPGETRRLNYRGFEVDEVTVDLP